MSRLSSSATTIRFCKWASKNSPPPPQPLGPTAFSPPTSHPRNPATIAAFSPLIISTRSSLARPLPRTSASRKSPPAPPASSISSPAPVLPAPKMLSPTICPRFCAAPAASRNSPLPSASASRSPAMFPFSAASRMPPSSARRSCPKLKKRLCQILHLPPLTPPLPLLLLVSARSRKLPATVFPAARPRCIGARSPHEYPSNPSSANVFLSTFNFCFGTALDGVHSCACHSARSVLFALRMFSRSEESAFVSGPRRRHESRRLAPPHRRNRQEARPALERALALCPRNWQAQTSGQPPALSAGTRKGSAAKCRDHQSRPAHRRRHPPPLRAHH